MAVNGTDVVYVRRLPVDCIIGVNADERVGRQRLLISAEISLDLSAAAAADDLEASIDYVAVAARMEEMAANGRYRLIETLAVRLAEALLELGSSVLVEVEKPAALAETRQAGVRVRRTRSAR